jgi:iron complex transport system substrate-binding protein
MATQRIVSLLASATEIVCALGFEDQLVGRSHECDFPPSVQRLPVCTEPKFPVDGSSNEIDQRVKAILQDGLSVYRVDADRLRELQPTVIVTQSHCDVCAVSLRDVEATLADALPGRPVLVSLAADCLADVWADIRRVASALQAPERGEALIQRLQKRIEAIARKAGALPRRPGTACIEWIEPLMTGGNWMPELVDLAGGRNLVGVAGKHSSWMTWRELGDRAPEVIVVAPCGFDIERSQRDIGALRANPDWPDLPAVRLGRVYLADGNQFFNRPGPRLVESLEILAEILHPETFVFGHEGRGWRRFSAGKSSN